MNLNEYQNQAMDYRLETANEFYAITSLAAEVGELFGHLAKATRDGEPEGFPDLIKKELGDIMWSVAAISADLGFTLDDVAQANIDKLESRRARGVIQGAGDNR